MSKKIFIKNATITLLVLMPILGIAQSNLSKVLVRNAGIVDAKQTISIKWYSQDLVYPEGVNIYRKENKGEWQKINSYPIKILDSLPVSEYQKDQDLNFFVPLIKGAKKEDIKGLILFQVLVKSWESEVYSKFLGIQYDDATVQQGKIYTYKINKIKGNAEYLIAESTPIIAGPEVAEEPIKEIIVKTDTNKVKIKWKPEEQRFFAVNIYRTTDNKEWLKIIERPLVISKYRDTLGILRYPEIFALDDSLKEGIYFYQLTGLDFFGKETRRSESFKVEIKDLIPPAPPEELKDSVNNLDVTIKWKNLGATGITGINVYRSVKSAGPFIKLNSALLPSSTSSFKDKVERAGPYYYYVASVDKAGNEGKSRPTFAEVHDIVPPLKPIGLIAQADTGKINLTWHKNKEPDVIGYLIYRTANKNDKNNFALINANPITETSFTDKLPASAKNKFLYKIVAIDSSYNKSAYSEAVSVQMPDIVPPVKPLIKNVYNTENAIAVSWLPNKDADLKGYNLYRGTSNENFSKINAIEIPSSLAEFIDRDVNSGQDYFYYLVAMDSAGNQSRTSNIQRGFNNYNTIKSSPKNLILKYREDKNDIRISWEHEKSDQLLGYVIYRRKEEKGQLVALGGQIKNKEYYDKDVMKGNTYYYEIRAYDKMGNIVKSEVKKIIIK